MTWFQAVVLGIIQGLTEFVPVSSSGHLVLIPRLLSWPGPSLAYDTVLHLGTLLALVISFWSDWLSLASAWIQSVLRRRVDTNEARLAWFLILATVPAAVMGMLWEDEFEALFDSPIYVAIFLLITGTWLMVADRLGRKSRRLADLSWWQALVVGVAQGLAIAPGISRSGATIGAGLVVQQERESAARFSFLLSAPIILGAGVLQVKDMIEAPASAMSLPVLLLGFVTAFVAGYACIRFLLAYLRQHSLTVFAVYCWAAGLLALAFLR